MDPNQSSGAAQDAEKTKKLIRSKFKDVMVKAGEDVYYLDRIKLALKSDYFEKLFVHYWNDQKNDPIEIPFDSDTFSTLVDVIYDERSWKSVLNWDNYVSVLMAKDFLQLKEDDRYGYSTTYEYLSANLKDLYKREEFLSLPLDHFIKTLENETQRYDDKTGQICARWICYDLKNRLPHLAKVANAARRRLELPSLLEECSTKVKLSDIDEQTKYEVVERYINRLLYFRSQSVIDHTFNEPHSSYSFESSETSPRNRMKEYLENSTFYDITVRVDGKAYKLHRCVLQSKSAYFEELFSAEYAEATVQCEGVPDLPNKDEEYLIEGIDQATFDLVIDYIYLELDFELSSSNIVPILKAADILRIKDLLQLCKYEVERCIEKRDSKDTNLMTLIDYLRGKKQHENLYMSYLIRHVGKFWSDEAHMGEFFSMSIDTLKHLLQSSEFYLDDPHEMLDMCSKWFMHDVKNRYHLIPQIALAINGYGIPDYEDYKMEIPSDLAYCSEQSIRDKIWEIIRSTSLIPVDTEPNKESMQFEESPLFITSKCEDERYFAVNVRNANLVRIATFSFKKRCFLYSCENRVSATLINDNLFLFCWLSEAHFLVYNLPSKKLITLNVDRRMGSDSDLLNCRNELYCCSSLGPILKYSRPLNRWMSISRAEFGKEKVRFTSDGKKLYRMYELKGTERSSSRYVEAYSFEQNAWISLPVLPPHWHSFSSRSEDHSPVSFTTINECDPAILFKSVILWFDCSSQTWHEIALSQGQEREGSLMRRHSVIAQGEHAILHVNGDKLYEYSKSKGTWNFKAEMPDGTWYFGFVAVNRLAVCARIVADDNNPADGAEPGTST